MRMRGQLLAAAVVVLSGCGRTEPAAPPPPVETPTVFTPRPLRNITVARTPERVERGRYLSEGLLQCFVCHSERDWKKPGAPPIPATKGAGYVWRAGLTAPNLTPDKETGIGTWTDDMLIRAIREGISHDGRVLHQQMWSGSFRSLPDDDVEAIVAYLRSLKPIHNSLPKTNLTAEEIKRLKVPEPLTLPVRARQATDPIQHGRELANLADCSGCHTSWYTPRNPGLFGGGNLVTRGDVKTYGANITSDDSGITHYDAAFFREVMRTGKARGRELSPIMPWTVFRNLNDDDLDALFGYLRAMPKVKHLIDNIDKPTKCAACGGEHPLGQYNKPPRELKPVSLSANEVKDFLGTYRYGHGALGEMRFEKGTLMIRFDDGNVCTLVTEDKRVFGCAGELPGIEFVRDASGKVTGLLDSLEPAVKIR